HAMHEAFHHTHSDWDPQDMRNMGGLRHYMKITWITLWIATLAIAGVWPFAGFFSKDEIIWQAAARAVGPYAGWVQVIWVVAMAAAMLTAFYMTRLMVMTFHGENRLGAEERKHLHEVPRVMTVPLLVLAVLSVVGGWVNVPHAVGDLPLLGWIPHSEWLHEWLHPVTAAADRVIEEHLGAFRDAAPLGGGASFWAVASFLLAVAIILLTARAYRGVTIRPAVGSAPPTGLRGVLYNKWYVDEIYDAAVVRPIIAASRGLWRWVDQGLIDGLLVNGAARLFGRLGLVGARLQSGQINAYAFAIAVGVLILLGFVVL